MPEDPSQPTRAALRLAHGVALVSDADDGAGIHRLPNGVYGFTYSPGLPDTPLFHKTGSSAFEVHKLPDGDVILVGFLPEQLPAEACDIELWPAPRDGALVLAPVPMKRVEHVSPHSMRETGALRLRLGPK